MTGVQQMLMWNIKYLIYWALKIDAVYKNTPYQRLYGENSL